MPIITPLHQAPFAKPHSRAVQQLDLILIGDPDGIAAALAFIASDCIEPHACVHTGSPAMGAMMREGHVWKSGKGHEGTPHSECLENGCERTLIPCDRKGCGVVRWRPSGGIQPPRSACRRLARLSNANAKQVQGRGGRLAWWEMPPMSQQVQAHRYRGRRSRFEWQSS